MNRYVDLMWNRKNSAVYTVSLNLEKDLTADLDLMVTVWWSCLLTNPWTPSNSHGEVRLFRINMASRVRAVLRGME